MTTLYRIKKPHFLINLLQTPLSKPNLSPFSSTPTSPNPLSPQDSTIVDKLLHIFTKNPHQKNQELDQLGPNLTTHIVETTLKTLKSWRISQNFFNWASKQPGYRHSCYTFNLMAQCLSCARQNDAMRDLAGDVVRTRCYFTPGAMGFFVRCLGSVGLVDEANVTFDEMKRLGLCAPDRFSYNCLLDVVSKTGDVGGLEVRLREMEGYGWVLDKYALTPALQCYCNAGRFDDALGLFGEMRAKGLVDGHVLSVLLVGLTKWGKVDEAYGLFEEEGVRVGLNEKTCFVLVHGFVREGRSDMALELLDRMRRKMGFVPDISVYSVLIEGLCRSREFEKAMQVYEEMNDSGIHPDVKIVTGLVSCACDEKDMIRIVEKCENLDFKDKVTLYNSMLTGLVNSGLADKAYGLLCASTGLESGGDFNVGSLVSIKELAFPNTESFEIVIDGLCRVDRLEVALRLFRHMDCIGCKRSVLLYNNLIDCLGISDRLDECYELFNEMKQSEFQPTHYTYNSIFGCLCRRGDDVGALAMVREMHLHGHQPWIKYYTLLMQKLCKDGQADKASSFLDGMVKEGFLPDVVGYSAVIGGLVKIKQLDKALNLFRDICARGYCPDVIAYNIMINGLCKANRLHEAESFFDEMMGKGLTPSVVTYNSLIDGWCKNGDIDRAMVYLTRMTEKEREPNVITYTTLINGLCIAGRPNDAMRFFAEMEANGNGEEGYGT